MVYTELSQRFKGYILYCSTCWDVLVWLNGAGYLVIGKRCLIVPHHITILHNFLSRMFDLPVVTYHDDEWLYETHKLLQTGVF